MVTFGAMSQVRLGFSSKNYFLHFTFLCSIFVVVFGYYVALGENLRPKPMR